MSNLPTDFNDMHKQLGLEAVRECIEAAVAVDPEDENSTNDGIEITITGACASPDNDTDITDEAELIRQLAALDPIAYDRARKEGAQLLNVSMPALDKAVNGAKRVKSDKATNGNALIFEEVEPWPDAVDGSQLLTEIAATARRFIVCDANTYNAVALWIVFSWLIDVVQVAPIAAITAPEKRCGKTQLLALIGYLCRRPLTASNISPAALFRCVEAWAPTLLIDEADAFLKEKEELRGILNCGHTRQSAFVIRVEGEALEPRRFSTWGAKAISGIGHMADTLRDRSIELELRRRLPNEKVEKLRHADPALWQTLREKLARFTEDAADKVKEARPTIPEALHDRAADNWEPLLAIADVVGGAWPELARRTALNIAGAVTETPSANAELLTDIREVFARQRVDRLHTADLLTELCADEEAPWNSWNRGRPMTPRQLSNRLHDFGIRSDDQRIGLTVRKGYRLEQFKDAFLRYLPESSLQPATTLQPLQRKASDHISSATSVECVADRKPLKPLQDNACSVVADEKPEQDTSIYNGVAASGDWVELTL